MKKLLFSIGISLFFSTVLYAETTIRITNGEWAPYLSEYSYNYGLASHIVSEALKLEGTNVQWGFFPWKRSYFMAKNGEWDASAGWLKTKVATEDFLISEPLINMSFVFFHLRNRTFQWESLKDLKGLRIGGTRGYHYGNEFMTAIEKGEIRVDFVNSDKQNYKKMLYNRVDIFPNDPIVGYSQLRSSFSSDEAKLFTHHPKVLEKNTLHLIISREVEYGRSFLEKFNSGMKKQKESGKLDQMIKDLEAGKYDKRKSKWKEPTKKE